MRIVGLVLLALLSFDGCQTVSKNVAYLQFGAVQRRNSVANQTTSGPLKLVPQRGHFAAITAAATTPDGSATLTGAADGELIFWDADGRVRNIVHGHDGPIVGVTCSTDGKLFATASTDGLIKFWTPAGRYRFSETFTGLKQARISAMLFSPSGKELILAFDHKVRGAVYGSIIRMGLVGDIKRVVSAGAGETGGEFYVESDAPKSDPRLYHVRAIAYDSAYKRIASYHDDGYVRIWSICGKLISRLRTSVADVEDIEFIGSGKEILVGGDSVQIVDIATGRAARIDARFVQYLRRSDEIVTRSGDTGEIRSIDGRIIRSFKIRGDGRFIRVVRRDRGMRVVETVGDRSVGIYDPSTDYLEYLGWNPSESDQSLLDVAGDWNSGVMALLNGRGEISTWETNGALIGVFGTGLKAIALGQRGSIVYGVQPGRIVAWNPDGTRLFIWSPAAPAKIVAMSAAGNRVAIITDSGQLWLAASSTQGISRVRIRTLDGTASLKKVVLSSDGGRAAVLDSNGLVRVLDDSGVVGAFTGPYRGIQRLSGNRYAMWGKDEIDVTSPGGGVIDKRWKVPYLKTVAAPAIASDGSALWVSTPTTVETYDWGKPSPVLVVRTGFHQSLFGLGATRNFLTCDGNGGIHLWNARTGSSVTLFRKRRDWIMYAPDGVFAASRNGGRLVAISSGARFSGVDQIAAVYNRPDVLLRRLGIDEPSLLRHFRYAYRNRLYDAGISRDKLKLSFDLPTARLNLQSASNSEAKITFHCARGAAPLRSYNIFVNDVPQYPTGGRHISGNTYDGSAEIALLGGLNKIEVSCTDSSGAESWRDYVVVRSTRKTTGRWYFVGIGVSTYQDRQLRLRYAAKDARDLSALFRRLPFPNGARVITLVNDQVSRKRVLALRAELADTRPQDTVVVFIAGHGVYDNLNGRYYYLTYGTRLNDIPGTALSFSDLESLLDGIPARHKLWLLDTCESGIRRPYSSTDVIRGNSTLVSRGLSFVATKAEPASQAERPPATSSQSKPPAAAISNTYNSHDRFIDNSVLRRTGTIVFSSSTGDQFSYESQKLKNGLFTSSILTALEDGAADLNHDGYTSTEELRAWVRARVAKLSDGRQTPTVDRDNIYQDVYIPTLETGAAP